MAQPLPVQLESIEVSSGNAFSGDLPMGRNHVFALQAEWPASGPVGTAKVQVTVSGRRWEDIPDSEVAVDGNEGGQIWNYERAGISRARVYFTRTSGSGTIVVTGDAKGAP